MTDEETEKYIREMEEALAAEQQQKSNVAKAAASSMFLGAQDSNLIEFQLEMDNLLERIDHLLRGHELKFDDEGNLTWQEPKDKKFKIFNEYGVQEILRILSMYLNRNTILSNYDEETIGWKVYDLAYDLTDLIFMKYEEFFSFKKLEAYAEERGYKSEKEVPKEEFKEINDLIHDELSKKIKIFPMMVREITDTVHSAYLRALNGGERESLRSARMVTQQQTETNPQQFMQRNKPKWYNPFGFGSGMK